MQGGSVVLIIPMFLYVNVFQQHVIIGLLFPSQSFIQRDEGFIQKVNSPLEIIAIIIIHQIKKYIRDGPL